MIGDPAVAKFLRRFAAVVLISAFAFHLLAFRVMPSNAPFTHQLTKKQERWVRQILAKLTLDEKIGQMMTVSTNAVFMNRESNEFKTLRRRLVDNKVGGVILFRSQVWATAMLTNHLQEMARVPLLVSSDLEMGPGMRLDDTTWWAPNMAVAAAGVHDSGAVVGRPAQRLAAVVGAAVPDRLSPGPARRPRADHLRILQHLGRG